MKCILQFWQGLFNLSIFFITRKLNQFFKVIEVFLKRVLFYLLLFTVKQLFWWFSVSRRNRFWLFCRSQKWLWCCYSWNFSFCQKFKRFFVFFLSTFDKIWNYFISWFFRFYFSRLDSCSFTLNSISLLFLFEQILCFFFQLFSRWIFETSLWRDYILFLSLCKLFGNLFTLNSFWMMIFYYCRLRSSYLLSLMWLLDAFWSFQLFWTFVEVFCDLMFVFGKFLVAFVKTENFFEFFKWFRFSLFAFFVLFRLGDYRINCIGSFFSVEKNRLFFETFHLWG